MELNALLKDFLRILPILREFLQQSGEELLQESVDELQAHDHDMPEDPFMTSLAAIGLQLSEGWAERIEVTSGPVPSHLVYLMLTALSGVLPNTPLSPEEGREFLLLWASNIRSARQPAPKQKKGELLDSYGSFLGFTFVLQQMPLEKFELDQTLLIEEFSFQIDLLLHKPSTPALIASLMLLAPLKTESTSSLLDRFLLQAALHSEYLPYLRLANEPSQPRLRDVYAEPLLAEVGSADSKRPEEVHVEGLFLDAAVEILNDKIEAFLQSPQPSEVGAPVFLIHSPFSFHRSYSPRLLAAVMAKATYQEGHGYLPLVLDHSYDTEQQITVTTQLMSLPALFLSEQDRDLMPIIFLNLSEWNYNPEYDFVANSRFLAAQILDLTMNPLLKDVTFVISTPARLPQEILAYFKEYTFPSRDAYQWMLLPFDDPQDLEGFPMELLGSREKVELTGRSFAGLILQEAIFREEDLAGCDFSHADLSESILHNIRLDGANLEHTLLAQSDWTKVLAREIKADNGFFSGSLMEDVVFTDSNLQFSMFLDSELRRVDFQGCDLTYAYMAGCDFNSSRFNNTNCEEADFSDSFFEIVDFNGANLSNALFSGCTFYHTSFDEAQVDGALFENVEGLDEDVLRDLRRRGATVTVE